MLNLSFMCSCTEIISCNTARKDYNFVVVLKVRSPMDIYIVIPYFIKKGSLKTHTTFSAARILNAVPILSIYTKHKVVLYVAYK